ncbi:MAG: zinc ribbon domain-containing protein [Acetatifactor sp.]|nr:zinc ribbon domain-containing protein [Acetatifactor sp.]
MFCQFCGANLPDDSKFCTECGKPLSGQPGQSAGQPRTTTVSRNPRPKGTGLSNSMIVIIALVLVVVVGAVAVLLFRGRGEKAPGTVVYGNEVPETTDNEEETEGLTLLLRKTKTEKKNTYITEEHEYDDAGNEIKYINHNNDGSVSFYEEYEYTTITPKP